MRILILKKILDLATFFVQKIENIYNHLLKINHLGKKNIKILSRNNNLFNIHSGERCFVIANGPSLKKMDIDFIKNEISFSVNSFFKYKNINQWQPTYNLLLDALLFDDATVKESTFYKDLSTLMPKTKLIAPLFRGYSSLNNNNYLKEMDIYYTAHGGSTDMDLDFCKVIPTMHGVASYALSAAIYTGCNPIYLIGFDHDYLANRGKMDHFFDGPTINTTNKKFDNKYNKSKLSDRVPFDEELISNYRLWQDYRYLLKIAKKRGIKIYNSTNGGFLDVFERFNFDNIDK